MLTPDLANQRISFLETIQSALRRYQEITAVIAVADTRDEALVMVQAALGCDDIHARAVLDLRWEQLTAERRDLLAAELQELRGA